jgi:hypothetical protein
MAIAAMPTAVLMGMGLTPQLAQADDRPDLPKSTLTAEEYQACVEVIEEAEKGGTPEEDKEPEETPGEEKPETPEEPAPEEPEPGDPEPEEPEPEEPDPDEPAPEEPAPEEPAPTEPAPEEEPEKPNLLDGIGDALGDLLDGPEKTEDEATAEEPDAGTPAEEEPAASDTPAEDEDAEAAPKDEKPSEAVKDVPREAVEETAKALEEAEKAADEGEPAAEETAGPAVDPEDCPVATDEEGGLENIVALPDRAWELQASSLLLKGARYEGVVKVKTANGTVKEVLKYVVSNGTDIGDLHQIVHDEENGATHHAVAGKGTTSTIRGGDTVMYTESISGNLLGLLPVAYSPENPPPLDIPIIYFTEVKVVQAGQFGGDLSIPGLRQYID